MAANTDVELSFEDLTFGGEDDQNQLQEKDQENQKNVVFVSTTYGGKIHVPALIKLAEEKCGALKLNNFREKQSFGFLQFKEAEGADKAIEYLNNAEVEGYKLAAERCTKITPGRDPRTHEIDSEFKNSTLVFKNLPFQLKQEKLEELLNSFDWKPQSVSYLYDSSGMFRGMAFVKYKEIDQATKVFEKMNDMDILGRKLRIEYKRKVKEAEVEDNAQKIYEQLFNFKSNTTVSELAFPCGSSFQRKQLHQYADKLGLVHFSTGEGETRYVLVKKKDVDPITQATPPTIITSHASSPTAMSKGQPIKSPSRKGSVGSASEYKQKHSYEGRSSPDDKAFVGSPSHQSIGSEKFSRSFGVGSFGSLKSPPSSLGLATASPTYRNSALVLNRNTPEGPAIQPLRQPKGPDGSTGFTDSYKKSRVKE